MQLKTAKRTSAPRRALAPALRPRLVIYGGPGDVAELEDDLSEAIWRVCDKEGLTPEQVVRDALAGSRFLLGVLP